MALVDELRKRFPKYAAFSDGDIVHSVAQRLGEDPLAVAKELGIQINDPGFMTGFKSGLAGYPAGVGRLLEDAGVEAGRGLRQYGEDIQFRNPTTVHDFESFAQRPWQGFKEIIGQAMGSTLPALIPYVGPAARVLGPMGSGAVGAGIAAVPSYGDIRQTQMQTGQENIPAALAGGLATGFIEQLGGVQRLLRPGSGRMIGPFAEETVRDFGRTPLRTGLRTGLRVQSQEGFEELAQNPIEQYAGGQDPMEHLGETAFAGFAGFIGASPFGVGAGLRRGFQQSAGQEYAQRTLASDAPMTQQMNALDISRQIDPESYNPALEALTERIYQGMLANQPVDLLQASAPMPTGQLELPLQNNMAPLDPASAQLDIFGGGGTASAFTPPQVARAAIRPQPTAPAPSITPFVDLYKQSGGIYSPVQKALGEVQTPEQATAVVQNWLENKRPSQKVLQALEEVHKKLTGKTFTQVLKEREANAVQIQNPAAVDVRQQAGNGQTVAVGNTIQPETSRAKTQRVDPRTAPGPVTIIKGEQAQPAQTDADLSFQLIDEDEKKGGRLAFMPSDWGANIPFNRDRSLHDTAREVVRRFPAMAEWIAFRQKEKQNVIRQTPLPGPSSQAQQQAGRPVQEVQAQASAGDARAREQADEIPDEVATPENALQMVLGEVAKRDPIKAVVLDRFLQGQSDVDIAKAISTPQRPYSKQRVQQMRQDATAMAEGIARSRGLRPEQFRDQELDDETAGNVPSSFGRQLNDPGAIGLPEGAEDTDRRDTGYKIRAASDVNSGNIAGEATVGTDGTLSNFTPDREGEANTRLRAFEASQASGETDVEAILVWNTTSEELAHQAAAEGDREGRRLKPWKDTQPETKKEWTEFYAAQKAAVGKSDRQKDAGIARKLREYLKRASYSRDLFQEFAEQGFEGFKQVEVGDSPLLMRAMAYRFANGYGPILNERLEGFYTVTGGLRGDAAVLMADSGKYVMIVRADIWENRRPAKYPELYLRMFHHELEHIVDNSALLEGEFSSDPVLEGGNRFRKGGALYQHIKAMSEIDAWVKAMFAYPMDPKQTIGTSGDSRNGFMKELHAQIMSLYHIPGLRHQFAVRAPEAHYYAEKTDEKIRAELGRRVQAAPRQEASQPEGARAAGTRQSGTLDSRADGDAPRTLFAPQGHEGYAQALGRLEADLQSRDSKRIGRARQQFLNLGRTPVVMRAVLDESGSKPFRKSDVMTGTGATVYLKGIDVHQGALHGGAVPMNVLKRLPELLADPVAIFKSSRHSDDPNSYKVVVDAEVGGAPVVVAMKPNHPIKEARGEPAHFTVTIFPLKRGWPMAGEWVEAGLLRYVNDQHPSVAGQGTGPQGGKPRLNTSLTGRGPKVVTKTELEGTPSVQWSKGLDELIANIPEAKTAAVTSVADAWAKYKPTLLTLHQMVDQFGAKLAPLKDYVASMDKMEQRQNVLMNKAHSTLTKWQGMHGQTRHALNAVMLEATTRGIHPDEAFGPGTPNEHITDQDEYLALKRKYDALDSEAKELYKEVRKLLSDNWQARKESFARAVKTAYDKLISDATDPARKLKLEQERDKEINDHAKRIATLKGPYFPLLRFGDYLMIAESKELQAAQKQLDTTRGKEHADLRKHIDRLKKDGSHYVVQAFESRYKAEQAVTLHSAKGLEARAQLAEEHLRSLQPVSAGAVDRIGERLLGQFDKQTAEKLKSLITELYISTLPEHAALQRQLKRQGIEGATSDMLRATAEVVEKDSFYLSRMEFADEITSNLFKIRQETKGNIDLGHVYRDLARRAALDFEFRHTPIQNFLARMSGVWHLGMSPAYLLTNSTQPWLVTAPVLAGKFGLTKSLGALRSAWVDAANIIVQSKSGGAFADINFNAVADPGERAALKAIMDRGQIDITQNLDMGLIADGTDPKFLKLQKAFNWTNHHIEASNRIVTGLAAYRLARTQGMDQQAAQDYAFKQVVDTQLNYTDANAAYWMKRGAVPLGKLIFQFRKYQQGMLYLLARNAQLAFQGDKDALRALGYLATTQLAMAGAMGIPVVTAPLAAFSMFAGADDPEGDPQTKLRNYLADTMGPDVARAFWKGLPTLLGLDVSQRIGMGDIWKPLPFLRLTGKTGTEDVGQLLAGALGAPLGMLGRMWDGAKLMEKGDWQKGIEKLMPKMISDIVKAERYADEGISTRVGTTVIRPDRLDGWDVAFRAAGFTPTVESEHYAAQQSKENTAQAIDERRSRLLANYANAKLQGKDVGPLLDAIDNWNAKHPDRGVRIDRSSMLRSVQARRKGAGELDEAGVRFKKNEKSLRGIDRYAFGA